MSEQRSDAGAGPRAMADEEVAHLWEQFKGGGAAPCPRDEAPLALAVDGASKLYRLVCTRCGKASLWFEITPTGLHVRSADEPPGAGISDD
jgi:hypothetical protein